VSQIAIGRIVRPGLGEMMHAHHQLMKSTSTVSVRITMLSGDGSSADVRPELHTAASMGASSSAVKGKTCCN
jgi:hypothetical protein